jgi:hypothetical protein
MKQVATRAFITLSAALLIAFPNHIWAFSSNVSAQDIRRDIFELASPAYAGRQAGTPGDWKAALFMAQRFSRLGFKGAARTGGQLPVPVQLPQILAPFFQPFSLPLHRLVSPLKLSLTRGADSLSAYPGRDFIPLIDSPSASLTARITFAGYGLADDLKGRLIDGKVLLILNGSPKGLRKSYRLSAKVAEARKAGARALLLVTGPELTRYQRGWGIGQKVSAGYSRLNKEEGLPVVHITARLAGWILRDKSLKELQIKLDRLNGPIVFDTDARVSMEINSQYYPQAPAVNVLAKWEGTSKGKEQQWVVIGAHRDAYGQHAGGLFFPGADDNASGSAILLSLAKAIAGQAKRWPRGILLVSFSGEEIGLLGARFFVSGPPVPLNKIAAMINIDAVGVGNGKVAIGLSGVKRELVERAAAGQGIDRGIEVFGYFPGGDHVPFHQQGINTIVLYGSGGHPDMHQPGDSPEKIDSELAADIARLALGLVEELAQR